MSDPGHIELEDVKAARVSLIQRGQVSAEHTVVCGTSWGGYLALLAIGTQPADWATAVAEVPIADYVTAYEDELEAAKAFDRYLFGGTPAEVPDSYKRASPLTYANQVKAPVLLIAGRHDPGCSARQVRNYRDSLTDRGHPVEYHECDMGHGTPATAEKIHHQALILSFISRYVS
jgi:dipeptidyl aminopeptidase/acylaminoacyl peptidase